MTDWTDSDMTDQDDSFDPVVAERFRVLDGVTAPDVPLRPVASVTPLTPPRQPRRSAFLLAVAAAAAIGLLAVGAVAVIGGGDGSIDVADEVGLSADDEEGLRSEGTADGDGEDPSASSTTRDPLVVDGESARPDGEGDTDAAAAGDADERDDADGGEGDAESSTETTHRTEGSTVTTAAESGSTTTTGSWSSTVPTVKESLPTIRTTVVTEPDPGTEPTTKPSLPPETKPTISPETTVPKTTVPPEVETVTIRGTVTEVFTDCVSRLVLNEAGKVVETGPISCDGGSYIVVNRVRVYTASGFVPADMAYNKHPADLKPGQRVSVVAAPFGGPDGPLALACDACRLTII